MASNIAFMINNSFVQVERNRKGDIVRAFINALRNSPDIVYLRGSRANRVWKSVKTPYGKDETEEIKTAVLNLLEQIQHEERNSTIGKIIGDIQQPFDLGSQGKVVNFKTLIYETMVQLAEQFITNPFQPFRITNPATGTLVDITQGLLMEMPKFIEKELASCAWQVPIIERIYCSKLMYGVENQAAIFNKEGNRFMSLLEFDVPGVINWFKIIRKNPTINSSNILRLGKGYDEPQIIPHISPKRNVSVSMVTPSDALKMMGVDIQGIPFDSFASSPILLIFFALCFHEIFPDEKIVPALLASNRRSMYVDTYDTDGRLTNRERIIDEDDFDRTELRSDQSVVYVSSLETYMTIWVPGQHENIMTKFGGLTLQ